jgi:pimeloyl-ACP methyl ester carboxylesterase
MARFVLVHGAWHGGWCWQLVAPIMRAAKEAHEVYTPTLTGMGERSHLLTSTINLDTHIRDITNLLYYEDLTDIVLVGHGAASLVINGAAEEMPDRIGHIVYFDAYMPMHVQFPFDIWPADQQNSANDRVTTVPAVRLPPTAMTLGITEEQMVRWVEQRLTPQPLSAFQRQDLEGDMDSTTIMAPRVVNIPRSYIHCIVGAMSAVTAPFAARARADGWDVFELAAGHDAMLTAPREVADTLMELIQPNSIQS